MPSYRPQAKIRCGSPASSWASAWVNGTPAGDGTTSRPGPISSSAPPQGSGRMTIPGPPPYGLSSTVRCTSLVHRRRSCTATWTTPASRALPIRDSSNGARYSGKIVTTSILTAVPASQVQQPFRRRQYDSAGVQVDRRDDRADERDQRPTAVGPAQHQQVGGRPVLHADHLAQILPGAVHGGESDQLEVEELVGVRVRGHVAGVDTQA